MIAAVLMALAVGQTPDHAFVLTGASRYAVLADVASVQRTGETARMRAFQTVDAAFTAAGEPYWGGWSWWSFDCTALTADRLDFASVREGGREGPSTPDTAAAYPAAPGSDAAKLLAVACSPTERIDATTLADAVRLGRAALDEEGPHSDQSHTDPSAGPQGTDPA